MLSLITKNRRILQLISKARSLLCAIPENRLDTYVRTMVVGKPDTHKPDCAEGARKVREMRSRLTLNMCSLQQTFFFSPLHDMLTCLLA
jgi:hypothetical protein